MPVFHVSNDANFYNICDLIVKNKDVAPVSKAKGVIISVAVLSGTYDEVVQQTEGLRDISVTERFGFPEVVFPGVSRNDFYITLEAGEFLFDRSTKNVEVSVTIRTDTGDVIDNCIYIGTGEDPISEYRSMLLYHVSGPRWNETIRLNLMPQHHAMCHAFFTVRQGSASSSKEIAHGFLRLTQPNGAIIEDGLVTVTLFKPPKVMEDPVYYLNEV